MAYADGTKVHVQVQDETRFALKLYAEANGISMNEAINKAIVKLIGQQERTERMHIIVPLYVRKRIEKEAKIRDVSINEYLNRVIVESFYSCNADKKEPITETLEDDSPLFEEDNSPEKKEDTSENNDYTLSLKKTVVLLNKSVTEIYTMKKNGQIPFIKLGTAKTSPLRFSQKWVEEYLKEQSTPVVEQEAAQEAEIEEAESIRREEVYCAETGIIYHDNMEDPKRQWARNQASCKENRLRVPVIVPKTAIPYGESSEVWDMETYLQCIPADRIRKISRIHFGYYNEGGTSQDGSKVFYKDTCWLVDLVPESILDLCKDDSDLYENLKSRIGEMTDEEEWMKAKTPAIAQLGGSK